MVLLVVEKVFSKERIPQKYDCFSSVLPSTEDPSLKFLALVLLFTLDSCFFKLRPIYN